MENVLYARAYTSEEQMEILDFVAAKFHEEPGIFKLLIVDSIMALFRVDFSGRGELADRQQRLAQVRRDHPLVMFRDILLKKLTRFFMPQNIFLLRKAIFHREMAKICEKILFMP